MSTRTPSADPLCTSTRTWPVSDKAPENGRAYVRSDSGEFLSPGSRFGYKVLCHDVNSTNWKILKAYFYLDYRCRGGVRDSRALPSWCSLTATFAKPVRERSVALIISNSGSGQEKDKNGRRRL